MSMQRKTKIVCTLGPACAKYETIRDLVVAGVDVFRLNFSFGKYEEMEQFLRWIKQAVAELQRPVATLGDLQGPKFRTGESDPEEIALKEGERLRLAYAPKDVKGTKERIVCPHENLMQALKPGDRILIYDGAMEIRVVEKPAPTEAVVEVVRGGILRPHKGLNVPTAQIKFDDLLPKDKRDAQWMLDQQLDYVGMSFVQTAEDVTRLRKFWNANLKAGQRYGVRPLLHHPLPLIISKIEKPQALDNIDSIVEVSDGLMVARGDLGVELSLEAVPIAQKMLIRKANEAGKPVITATQMLQSMTTEEVPTRAEVSDVANAVFDGTDAVMTSQETSMSPHPALVIRAMAKIVATAEPHLPPMVLPERMKAGEFDLCYAVAVSALEAALKSNAKAIITFSMTGRMTRHVSKGRPHCPIICLTPSADVVQRMCLLYDVYPLQVPLGKYTDTTVAQAEEVVLSKGMLKRGERVVLCAGHLPDLPALSHITKIYDFGEFLAKYAGKWTPKKAAPAAAAEKKN